MKFQKFIFIIFLLIVLNSCADKKEEKISLIQEDNLEMQMIDAYKQGIKEFNNGDVIFAAKKFNEVELIYPQSI